MRLIDTITRSVPRPVRALAKERRDLWLDLQDLRDRLAGKYNPLIPPRRLRQIICGDFEQAGNQDLELFKTLVGLKPDESILEIGCGPGRMAVALARFMSTKGSYEGMDITEPFIRWCREHITPRYPNFRFQHADVFNKSYNPNGRVAACDYTLPYRENAFDLVFLMSVFTHMLPEDMKRYLAEISRVTKVGRRCLITFFLLNPESLSLIQAGRSTFDFKNIFGTYRTAMETAEAAIAYDEAFIRRLYSDCGLTLTEPIHYGSWCGRTNFLAFQDFIVATRS
jgi:ubiquinone/menaquinone biosynthesis C-methylase UbiE